MVKSRLIYYFWQCTAVTVMQSEDGRWRCSFASTNLTEIGEGPTDFNGVTSEFHTYCDETLPETGKAVKILRVYHSIILSLLAIIAKYSLPIREWGL